MAYDLSLFTLRKVENTDRYRLIFGIGPSSRRVSGIEKIVQMVVKMLLTTPPSMKSHPQVGGGLLRLFQVPLAQSEVPGVQENLVVSIAFTEEQILLTQESVALPSDERLRSLAVQEVSFDENALSWVVSVKIVSEAGDDFVLDLSELIEQPEA